MAGYVVLAFFALVVVALVVHSRRNAPLRRSRPFEGDDGSLIGSGRSSFSGGGGSSRGTGDSLF
jgi:uncharacterized membrane protein YgcG